MRSKRLSTDSSSSFDVVLHAANWYENKIQKVDGLLLLQPTSPFRILKTLNKGINIFKKNKHSSVISVEQCRHNSDNIFRLTKKKYKYLKRLFKKTENIYRTNGSYFLTSPSELRKHKSFYNNNIIPLVCRTIIESVDIDTKDDWNVAKKLKNFKLD